MAGDWLKMRLDLADDPAVISIASVTGLDEYSVIGRLHKLWSWADRQSRDGHAVGVTEMWVDRYVERDGFAKAMRDAGWLAFDKKGLVIPNFDRHNGKGAKNRALAKDRKVTQRSRSVRDDGATREEKRREEVKTSTSLRSVNSEQVVLPENQNPTVVTRVNSVPAWEAYAGAYRQRYGVDPVRNAKVNGQLTQLVKRLGEGDAVHVAAFYVNHNAAFYVRARHPIDMLLRDCEGMRTQWATGIKSTGLEARSAETVDNVQAQIERVGRELEKHEAA